MTNVHHLDFGKELNSLADRLSSVDESRKHRVDGGDGGGDDGGMDARLKALELVIPTLATKSDVAEIRTDIHKAIAENHRWTHTALMGLFATMVLGVVGLLFTMYNATKPATATVPVAAPAAMPTIIINVPGAAPNTTAPATQPTAQPPKSVP